MECPSPIQRVSRPTEPGLLDKPGDHSLARPPLGACSLFAPRPWPPPSDLEYPSGSQSCASLCLQPADSAGHEGHSPNRARNAYGPQISYYLPGHLPRCLWASLPTLPSTQGPQALPCVLNHYPITSTLSPYSKNWATVYALVALHRCGHSTEGPSCALGPGPDSPGKWTVDDSREHSGDVLCDQG